MRGAQWFRPQRRMLPLAVQMTALAGAYVLAGRLALLLALPPGYATAVWPAAGIALAGLLLLGRRVAPGLWLGSFLVNLWTFLQSPAGAASIGHSIVLASLIGLGATLEALTAVMLVRRFVQFPNP